ncbi:BamA/TamA family outer membrane protein [Limibacillus halophilus]
MSLLSLTLFHPSGLLADQLGDQILSAKDKSNSASVLSEEEEDGASFVAVPVPIVDPTLGNGLAPAGLLTFRADEDASTPRSTIGLVAAYTDRESWMVGGGLQLYLDGDRWRTGLAAGYGVINLDYYGTSSDSIFFDNPVGFEIEGSVMKATLQRRIAEDFYLGAEIRRVDAQVTLDSPIDLLPDLTLDLDLAGLGLIGTFDSRDNTWFPTQGQLANASLLHYASTFGFDRDFNMLELDYAHYWPLLGEDLVLAAQVRAAQAGDGAPFFMLPYLNFRGFPAGKYLNKSALQGQAEMRWMFWRDLGAVAFAGTGRVAESFGDLGDGSQGYGLGAGVRYRISEADGMNAGLDMAYGSDDEIAVYFRIGEAF